MILLLALLAAEGFRVVQYAPKPVALRGCAECQGEPDDVCDVGAGVQAQPIGEYLKARWPAPGRLKLLRSKAEPDCAVPAKALLGPRAPIELAAVRMEPAPPAPALLDGLGPAADGWPRRLARRPAPSSRKPERAALREAVLCWPSERGWPTAARSDARPLDASNRCEAWLLAVKADTGEPDPGGVSFPLKRASFAYAPPAEAAQAEAPASGKPSRPSAAAALREPDPQPPPARAALPTAPCGDAARAKAATLDRFDQWDLQIRGAKHASLDRAAWALDAGAWAGHCQELDVLRSVLEQQLACAVNVSGSCAGEAR